MTEATASESVYGAGSVARAGLVVKHDDDLDVTVLELTVDDGVDGVVVVQLDAYHLRQWRLAFQRAEKKVHDANRNARFAAEDADDAGQPST